MIGEAPLVFGGRLIWVDPVTKRLLIADPPSLRPLVMPLSERIWSIAIDPQGATIGTRDNSFANVDLGTGRVTSGPALVIRDGCRLNDMAVDANGGLWAGSMHRGLLAGRGEIFYSASVEDRPQRVADGLGVANGMAFGPDGKTLYVVDTLTRTLLAYEADLARGTLSEPVVVTDFMNVPGKPDGMAVVPDGALWVAMWGGSCVVEVSPEGAVLRRVSIPAPHVSSLCWRSGHLVVTTSRMRLSPSQLASHPLSGSAFEVTI